MIRLSTIEVTNHSKISYALETLTTSLPSKGHNVSIRFGPEGLHLFDRTTGNNLLLDELEVPDKSWSKGPRHLSVALTNICDLKCDFCYAPKNSLAIEIDCLKHNLIDACINGCFGVGFGGGEPTLYRHFWDICEFTHKSTSLAVSFTTHGHGLHKIDLPKLSKYVSFVRVSMDGTNGSYEAIRGRCFNKLASNIRLLSKEIPFAINTVVNSRTVGAIGDVAEFAERYGAKSLALLPEANHGKGVGAGEDILDAMFAFINSYRGKLPIAISGENISELSAANIPFYSANYRTYAHIDAANMLKLRSYDNDGINLQNVGLIPAYEMLLEKKRNVK